MKKSINVFRFVLVLLVILFPTLIKGENLPAFPGAEGFGKYAVGGRGGKVVAVTNLDDYKSTETFIEGSLRWALSQYIRTDSVYRKYTAVGGGDSLVKKAITVFTPLTIVFKVSGTIWLKEELKIKRDSLTIAGQTAPGDGICIAGRSVLFNGATGGELFYYGPTRKELIVRYIRFRPGLPVYDGVTLNHKPTKDSVTYALDMENYSNVILDHCSMSWANEECLATYDTKNVTVQWCIISEGLYDAFHPKGLRSYGGVWGGQFASYHHNLIAHNVSRTARFNGARAHDTIAVIDYRNNVIYNWGNSDGPAGGEIEISGGRSEINIINNYYKKGPAYTFSSTPSLTNKGHRILQCYDASNPAKGTGKHYVKGNYTYGYSTVTEDNWKYGVQFKYFSTSDTLATYSLFRLNIPSAEVLEVHPISIVSAETSFTQVLTEAGAVLPLRDVHDKRIVLEVQNGTATGTGSFGVNKGIIDDPAVLDGWPIFTTGTVPTDTDGDGMPDDWEMAHNFNLNDPTDGNGIATSGYTNLEEYLNSIGTFQNFLQAPFNLKVWLNTSGQPALTWQDVSDMEQGYEIQRTLGVGGTYETIATTSASSSSYVDASTLEQGTPYTYRLRATDGTINSVFSNEVQIMIPLLVKNYTFTSARLYPNPVKNELKIESEGTISGIKLYNNVGILVGQIKKEGISSLDMTHYLQGVYYIELITIDNLRGIYKVIKL